MDVLPALSAARLVPMVVRDADADANANALAGALVASGLPVAEVTEVPKLAAGGARVDR